MSTTTDLTTLKINFLTQSQYNTAKAQGLIEDDEIYMTETSCLVSNKVGAIVAYAGSDEPQGWFKCDGRAVSRTDYAELFATIGTTFGSGDGSTTFNIPDLRGRVATGVGTLSGNTYTLGDNVNAGLPNITGTLYQRSTNYNVGNITWTGGGALAVSNDTSGSTADGLSQVNGAIARKKIDLNASNSNSIYGNSTTVQPNTLVLNFLICYENSVISGSGGGGPVDSTDEPTATKIAEFDSNAHMNSTDMTTQALETYVDSLDIQGSVFVDATDVPIAGEIAKFDSTANMSSTDMTTGSGGEVEAFVNGLNVSNSMSVFPVRVYASTSPYNCTTADTMQYTGVNVTIPANSFFAISARATYNGAKPLNVAINDSSTNAYANVATGAYSDVMCTCSYISFTSTQKTFYLWAKYATVNTSAGSLYIDGWYIKQ